MSELAEKLARRRQWENGQSRPPPPPPPPASHGVSTPVSNQGDAKTEEVAKSTSATGGNTSSVRHSPRPPPPSVPMRTYRSRDNWKLRPKLARESSQLYESNRSLVDNSNEPDGAMEPNHEAPSNTLDSHAFDTSGGHKSPGSRFMQRYGTTDSGSQRSLGNFVEDSVWSRGSSSRSIELGNSGSSRHLMIQMERINAKVSPPISRVQSSRGSSPKRSPPPPTTGSAEGSPNTLKLDSDRVPSRSSPPPPTLPSPQIKTEESPVRPGSKPPALLPHEKLKLQEPSSSQSKRPPAPPPHSGSGGESAKRVLPPPPPKTNFLGLQKDSNGNDSQSPRGNTPPGSPMVAQRRSLKAPIIATMTAMSMPPPRQQGTPLWKIKALEEMKHLKPALIRFYQIHNPSKISAVDQILARYGRDGVAEGTEKLNEALQSQYNADLKSIDMTAAAPSPMAISQTAASLAQTEEAISMIEEAEQQDTVKNLVFAKALYKFEGDQEGDLSFEAGQIIDVIDNSKSWWTGRYKDEDGKERKGNFPSNYVKEISEAVVLSLRAQLETLKPVTPNLAESGRSLVGNLAGSKRGSLLKLPSTRFGRKESLVAGDQEDADESQEAIPDVDDYSPELVKDDIFVTHYFKSVLELVTSEFKYVLDLFLANDVFVLPMYSKLGRDKTEMMIPSWGDILRVHERLLIMLMDTVPNVKSLEAEFVNQEVKPTSGGQPKRKSSHMTESSAMLDRVAGASAQSLKAFATQLDSLEELFAEHLESGRLLSTEQRARRVQFISQWVQKQCDVFCKLAPFLKTANTFISNYHHALETLEAFAGEDLALLSKLEEDPMLKNLKLRDFLIKPVQRVCKYPLLFREIIKYAPDEDTKVPCLKAQNDLMKIADQVNQMLKMNESGNAKKLAIIRQCIRPHSDVETYELRNAVLRRDGELSVVSCTGSETAPELSAMKALASQLQAKPKGTVRGLLFQDQLLLVEVQLKFITKAERLRVVHAFRTAQQWDSIKVEKVEQDSFSITLCHAADGPCKGAQIVWVLKSLPAARDGWVEDLLDFTERLEKVRERVSLARQQELRVETHRSKRRSGDEFEAAKALPPPAPPKRIQAPRGGLMSMIDELKTVQMSRLTVENATKSIV